MAVPTGKAFVDALVRARVIAANDLHRIRKIAITVEPHDIVTVHVDYAADENLLDALPALEGAAVEQKG